jgi:hypothetical protein
MASAIENHYAIIASGDFVTKIPLAPYDLRPGYNWRDLEQWTPAAQLFQPNGYGIVLNEPNVVQPYNTLSLMTDSQVTLQDRFIAGDLNGVVLTAHSMHRYEALLSAVDARINSETPGPIGIVTQETAKASALESAAANPGNPFNRQRAGEPHRDVQALLRRSPPAPTPRNNFNPNLFPNIIPAENAQSVPQTGPIQVNPGNPVGRIPTITTISPETGPANGRGRIRINGQNLRQVTSIWFGDSPCETSNIVNDQVMYANAPIGTPGIVYVILGWSGGFTAPRNLARYTYEREP